MVVFFRTDKRLPLCLGIGASFIVWVIYMVSFDPKDWTLLAGETRKISANAFTRNVQIDSSAAAVSVYNLAQCPSLTAPVLHEFLLGDFVLSTRKFAEIFIYMNEGSTMDVVASQETDGSTLTIWLFQGETKEKLIRNATRTDVFDNPIREYHTNDAKTHFTYKATRDDIFTIVFFNPSYTEASGDLSYVFMFNLTTYNLKDEEPTCANTTECVIDDPAGCLLVQSQSDDKTAVSVEFVPRRVLIAFLCCAFLALGSMWTISIVNGDENWMLSWHRVDRRAPLSMIRYDRTSCN